MSGRKRGAANTGARDSKGRIIYRGEQGGTFVLLESGKKRYLKAPPSRSTPSTPSSPSTRQRLQAQRLARKITANAVGRRASQVAMGAFAARAVRASKRANQPRGPRGMRASTGLYAVNANGTEAVDPVSLNRIPRRRAVTIGRQTFDANTLRALLSRDPGAVNPLTRQPFPREVYTTYGGGVGSPRNRGRASPTYSPTNPSGPILSDNEGDDAADVRGVVSRLPAAAQNTWDAAVRLGRALQAARTDDPENLPGNVLDTIERRYNVEIHGDRSIVISTITRAPFKTYIRTGVEPGYPTMELSLWRTDTNTMLVTHELRW